MSAAEEHPPAGGPAAGPAVTWHVPADGGTPREPACLIPLGPLEWRVLARAEEGRSPLSHALSRVDLLCRNATAAPLPVTVHIDLSGAATSGARTNFDESPFGGMPKRDFVYLQHRGGGGAAAPDGPPLWQRVDGTTQGWTLSVAFDVPPGETRLGLSPAYDYATYLAYVDALPEHPCLRRRLLGQSDGGREHWELTVTDPAVPAADKQRVFWHTREHAYETFSSYAIEGLIEYLLSPEAAAVRRRYEITLHPMTNVDGVADGAEYRGGYDFPDPLGTTTARLTRETVDRLRPELIVAWHNWHAPRDVDSLFFTDADAAGHATRRAFDRFTQRFPSPRRVGHRWQTEDDPQQRNWAVRRPTEAQAHANSHQYGLLHYGSRVWGWEMPWYGRDDTDGADPVAHARRAGADFGRAFFATQASLAADPAEGPTRAAPAGVAVPEVPEVPEVPCWGTHEFVLAGRSGVTNPFRDAALIGEFTAPGGRLVTVEGFYDPEDGADGGADGGAAGPDAAPEQRWRLRFAPDEPGEWRYRLRGEGVVLAAAGALRCVAPAAPAAPGPVRIDPRNPYAFALPDGRPFFGVGDTCYGLVSGISAAQRREYLDARAAQGFNFVRLYASGYPLQAHPSLDAAETWPWGGTAEQPDYDRLNPRFFRRLESILTELAARGLRAEILVFNLYLLQAGHGGRNPWGTAARERLWVRHLLARLSASPTVFLWTVANEFECYPDGAYRFDPGDVRWARRMGALLHDNDPYGHPTTVHPMGLAGGGLVRAQGPLFGAGPDLDVLTHQHNSYDTATRVDTPRGGYWDGSGLGVDRALRADREHRKPVINTEFGYEWLPGYPTDYNGQSHGTDKCRRTAWRILAAGGAALAAGFAGTWHGRDAAFRGRPAPFTVADAGAAAQIGILARCAAGLPLNRLHPFDAVSAAALAPGAAGAAGGAPPAVEALALADPGRTYLVYLPDGGRVTLDLSASAPGGTFAARWLDPRSGAQSDPLLLPGGGPVDLDSPDAADWVLTLTAAP